MMDCLLRYDLLELRHTLYVPNQITDQQSFKVVSVFHTTPRIISTTFGGIIISMMIVHALSGQGRHKDEHLLGRIDLNLVVTVDGTKIQEDVVALYGVVVVSGRRRRCCRAPCHEHVRSIERDQGLHGGVDFGE